MVHIVKIHHTTYVTCPPRPLFNVGVKDRQGMKNKKSPGKDPTLKGGREGESMISKRNRKIRQYID